MPSAYEIIRKRWPEVVLIVGLGAGMFMLRAQITTVFMKEAGGEGGGQLPDAAAFFLGLGSMACLIVMAMMYLGFVRTAYEGGYEACEPGQLVRIGRHYFWRTARFMIMFEFAHAFAAAMIVAVLSAMLLRAEKADEVPVWIVLVSATLALTLLVKFVALVPGIMVGRDMMVFDSIRALREHRFLEQGGALVLCSVVFALGSGAATAVPLFGAEGVLVFFLVGCLGAVVTVALLIAHLEALRVVAPYQEGERAEEGMDSVES